MAERLASATSPYLLQHADNPVDWWPWSAEAVAEAERRGVPIMLSVGYAACHWCHVMAHESFEDAETAAMINENFVAIKVDREERPDIDAVYMQATQAMTGQGGWPMTVFLTPDGSPFYAGTYFPPVPAHGMPAFRQVLDAVAEAWRNRRDEIVNSAETIASQLSAVGGQSLTGAVIDADLDTALTGLGQEFDHDHPGFGRAPKFPPSLVLDALLRYPDQDLPGGPRELATAVLAAMAAGGIHDQLGGGFARYSVDAAWTVPHFEKMLYDNALLLGCYTEAWRTDPAGPHAERFAEVVVELVGWLSRELRTAEGGFAASLDADSLDPAGQNQEGAFYAWTPEQLTDVLGRDDGAWAAEIFEVTERGTFEHGASTLTRRREVEDRPRLRRVRDQLLAERDTRSRPARDDKLVASWNGLMITALADAAQVFDRPDWLELAAGAAEAIWRVHRSDDEPPLRRTSRDGVTGDAAAVLDDHAGLLLGFLRLAEAGRTDWLEPAHWLAEQICAEFGAQDGGFFDTAAGAERLFTRPQDPTDNAAPSGLSTTIRALRRLAAFTGETRWEERADRAAASAGELVRRAPRFAGWLLADAVESLRVHPVQVAVVGDPADSQTATLGAIAVRHAPPGSMVIIGRPDADGVPLLADRPLLDDRPTAYVCRHFVCRLPVTDPDALRDQLRR